jgi:hypothetical protein
VKLDPSQYRPKYPDSPFIHVADIVDQDTGKTYREMNAETMHAIPIGTLVEVVRVGLRLHVVAHRRDCDMTPLYSLGLVEPGRVQEWDHGYVEDSLMIIPPPPPEVET